MAASQESRFIIAELRRITGKHYPAVEAMAETLDKRGLAEMVSLMHDIGAEIRKAERKGAQQPWRR